MARYFFKRLLLMGPTLLAIILVGMLSMRLLPGSNAQEFSSRGEGDWLDDCFETVGLHDTLIGGYVRYVYQLVTKLDFGGRMGGQPLGQYILERTELTLVLTLLGCFFSLLVGTPAGIFAAMHHNKLQDQGISVITLLLASIPSYCLAIFLILIFYVRLQVLPAYGFDSIKSFVLPTLVIAAGGIAATTRMARSATLEVLDKQYVTVLYAKGIGEKEIICRHILKNTLVPVISTLNNLFAAMLCGSLIVENVFSVLGIGQLVVRAVSQREQHLLLACIVVISLLLMSVNILCDFVCACINPQIRARYRAARGGKGGEVHG